MENKPEIFGRQLILDEKDEIIGEEENLLIVSSGVSVEEVAALVGGFGGIAVPAHIDKRRTVSSACWARSTTIWGSE